MYSNKCCKAAYLLDKLQKGDAGALLLWLVGTMHIKEDVDAHLHQTSEWFGDIVTAESIGWVHVKAGQHMQDSSEIHL